MRWRNVKQGKIDKSQTETKQKNYIPAPISDRLKAFLTDTFMITMPIMYIVIYLIMGSREGFREHMATGWLYIIIPHYLIVTLLWTIKGETPGMRAYDMKIIRWNSLENPNFFQSTIRYIAMPFSILSIVGVVIAFFRKDKATFHDLISLTRMIHAPEK
ncbi:MULTISPECIES: RDD family protein [unclassified Nitratiruptor]|uniref:RDD family protein n=1 Tax=unclassified Nitratiruptor TaxID=2624044 RepID=UPI0019157A0A|nr:MULTISPECIES: RDD family protein [unclassified Nitratiruptor]BCD61126.1 hypothetical protein NitYY0810_C1911 [Nitratiruptor sp. YY08-10]BCD65059.1 hypothetical protein NitYY0814_C1920 [Nitratiruptor sp. YY08-14]